QPRLPAGLQQPHQGCPRTTRAEPSLVGRGAQTQWLPPAHRRGDRRHGWRRRGLGCPAGPHTTRGCSPTPSSAHFKGHAVSSKQLPAASHGAPPPTRADPPALGACMREFMPYFSPRCALFAGALALTARIYVGQWSWLDLLPPLVLLSAQPF